MNVTDNYFEMGITFFTNLVYSAIRYGVSNGDVAPFVGHNAILRWSAVQDVAFEEDGVMKFWSESHVSEDFDIALRLQIKGYITRLAAWANNGFQEGVSLTVSLMSSSPKLLLTESGLRRTCSVAEICLWLQRAHVPSHSALDHTWSFHSPIQAISRFQHAYRIKGQHHLVHRNLLRYRCRLDHDGGQLLRYRLVQRMSVLPSLSTIHPLTLADIDKYYVNSWNIWITLIIVFNGLGNIALAALRYRTGERSFLGSLLENFKWLFMLFIFLGGISIHVSEALLAHMFEIDMSWGATAKTLEFTNFFIEVPKTLRKFWFSFSFSVVMIAAMIFFSVSPYVPWSWQINQLEALIPLASLVFSHFLLPLALNPGIMVFAW